MAKILLLVGPDFGRALLRSILITNEGKHQFFVVFFSDTVCTHCSYLVARYNCVLSCSVFGVNIGYSDLASPAKKADVCILLWWPEIVDRHFIDSFSKPPINIHPSPLPIGRGKSHNFWSVYLGLPVGATVHFIDESVDGGTIIMKSSFPAEFGITGRQAYIIALKNCLYLAKQLMYNIDGVLEGQVRQHYMPLTQEELHHSGIVRYSRDFRKKALLSLDKNPEMLRFVRHALAKDFAPYDPLLVSYANKKYKITLKISEL